MLIVHVHVHVKREYIEAFKAATMENARRSILEPGIARFDVIQQNDNPEKFILIEVYRNPGAPGAHKETAHYQIWRDIVAPMMAEPRTSVKVFRRLPRRKRMVEAFGATLGLGLNRTKDAFECFPC